MTRKCITCNGELSFNRISKCLVCRTCHPVKANPIPQLSLSLLGLEYCDTKEKRDSRIDEAARKQGWNPEKYIKDENRRRFG